MFSAQKILCEQASALLSLSSNADSMLKEPMDLLYNCAGKIITCGLGKSGIIARKIAANFNCIGIPSAFVHPTEAAHGDLGFFCLGDLVIFVSHNGKTRELIRLIPYCHTLQIPLVLITGNPDSLLAKQCDTVLNTGIQEEACPNNFLPTTSSLCAMALGDLLCLGLMALKHTTREELQKQHPGGSLGNLFV